MSGGAELLPGPVAHWVPQPGAVAGVSAKPLKLLGADPPLRLFCLAHWAPQNVTELPTEAFWSPITKAPPLELANTTKVPVALVAPTG